MLYQTLFSRRPRSIGLNVTLVTVTKLGTLRASLGHGSTSLGYGSISTLPELSIRSGGGTARQSMGSLDLVTSLSPSG